MRTNPKGVAVKIQKLLGEQIARSCAGTIVPESFLAGLIGVENPECNPDAARFEAGTYLTLKKLRNPLVFWLKSWNGITQADLKGKTDAELIDYATSFGYTQIMGWQAIILKRTVAEIRDPYLHLMIAVDLLRRNATRYLKIFIYGATLRIWNTGSPEGAVFDSEYITQALAVMQAYRQLQFVHTPNHDAPSVSLSPASSGGSPAGTT